MSRSLRNQIRGRLRLTDGERRTLAEIGKQLGKKALKRGREKRQRVAGFLHTRTPSCNSLPMLSFALAEYRHYEKPALDTPFSCLMAVFYTKILATKDKFMY